MGIFLGSNLLKKGVSWRCLKGSLIFALGFHTNHALNPNFETIVREAEESLDESKSLSKECVARIAKLKENQKTMRHLKQLYDGRMAELEEVKKANGRYTVETCCCESQSQAEYVWTTTDETI